MTIGSTKMLSMTAAIVRGVKKTDSHLVTDAESSALWDKLDADVKATKVKHPGAAIDIPNDPAGLNSSHTFAEESIGKRPGRETVTELRA